MRLLKLKFLFSLYSQEENEYQNYRFLYYRLAEFEPGSVRDAAARLEKSGLIDKISRNNQTFFRLTAAGREMLIKNLVFLKSRRPWDGVWRLVVIEASRGQSRVLEVKLFSLGYKRLTRGVYITPLAVSEATKDWFLSQEWQNRGQLIEVKRLVITDNQQLARKLWNLDVLNQKYLDFVSLSDRLLKLSRKNISLLRQAKGGFKTMFDRYFNLILLDPGLPKRLLPPDWPAEVAKELFNRLIVLAKTAGI